MKPETFENFVFVIVLSFMGLISLVSVLFGAWWHLLTLFISFVLARIFYIDDAYGTESVKAFFQNKKRRA